jgi:GAF domain-containing protein
VADEGTPDEITWLLLGEDRDGLPAEHVARPKEFAHALVDLATLPLHAGDDQKVLTEAVRICRRGLGEGYAVSLVVGTPAEPELVASSDAFAQQLDGMQAIASEGPCLDAWTTGHPVVATDLVHEERWPTLTADLASVPIQSMRASPIAIREQPLGVLNLYGTDHDLAAPDLTDLTDLVGLLAGALAAVLYEIAAKAELETLADQLNVALESRATIDQAKGIVMATMGCGPAEAYDLLKKISNDTNTKVRDVASDTVHRASTDGNEADAPL